MVAGMNSSFASLAPTNAPSNIVAAGVTLREDDRSFTLFNGLISARVEKRSGSLSSLHYQGVELLGHGRSGLIAAGYWSSVGNSKPGPDAAAFVVVNPATNGGARAEISCCLRNDPRSPESPLDADYRYALAKGEHWLYVYSILAHKPGYPVLSVGEARYCLKLNPSVFDYLNIDAGRRRIMPSGYDWDHGAPLNLAEARRMTTGVHKGEAEHKYDYSAVLSETPAYGWISTRERVGLWLINPSGEYLGGGPTKVELTAHLDCNPGGLPTLLNMWAGSHYGGTSLAVAANEAWTKVVGPFVLYCNAASREGGERTTELARDTLWHDALSRADLESRLWPYPWISDPDYPPESQRAVVTGQLVLRDPFAPDLKMSNAWVGVTAPDYLPPVKSFSRPGARRLNADDAAAANTANSPKTNSGPAALRSGFPLEIDWQRDSKFYQYWTRADAQGRFSIRHIRPGSYTLHAFADGVLGEFTRTNLAVGSGENKSLGRLEWTPVRFGRTVWEIGVPDRSAREFRHGNNYWHWGLYYDYPKEFPNDVNFIVGISDWSRDWNYVQPPRIGSRDMVVTSETDQQGEDEAVHEIRGGKSGIISTTWSITFRMPSGGRGKATLRLAFCGAGSGCRVQALVNGRSIGDTGPLPSTGAMHRDGIRGYWIEKDLTFDAALLAPGSNVIKLVSPATSWPQGVLYDCVRLEIDDPR